jgi:hypothetical protein
MAFILVPKNYENLVEELTINAINTVADLLLIPYYHCHNHHLDPQTYLMRMICTE